MLPERGLHDPQQGQCLYTPASKPCRNRVSLTRQFNIRQFVDSSPSVASKISMVDALVAAIGHCKQDNEARTEIDGIVEQVSRAVSSGA